MDYNAIAQTTIAIVALAIIGAFIYMTFFAKQKKRSYAIDAHHAIRIAGNTFAQTIAYSILNEDGSKEVKAQIDQLAVDLGKVETGTKMLLAMKKHPRFDIHADLINAAVAFVASPLVDLDKKLNCLAKIEEARKSINDDEMAALHPKLAVIAMTIVEDCDAYGIRVKVTKETINQSYAATRA